MLPSPAPTPSHPHPAFPALDLVFWFQSRFALEACCVDKIRAEQAEQRRRNKLLPCEDPILSSSKRSPSFWEIADSWDFSMERGSLDPCISLQT